MYRCLVKVSWLGKLVSVFWPRRGREREPPPRIRKVGAGGEKRARVPYPCWGLRRGAARRPLLLLPLLARPLRWQEAGPPLGSSPAELRRDKKAPPSARGAPRPVRSPRPARNRRCWFCRRVPVRVREVVGVEGFRWRSSRLLTVLQSLFIIHPSPQHPGHQQFIKISATKRPWQELLL